MIAVQNVAVPVAVGLGEPEWLVVAEILTGPTWSRPVEVLRRIAGLSECGRFDRELVKAEGERVLAGLVVAGWIVRWTPEPETLIVKARPRLVSLPEIATLTPLGAERLGYTLSQPSQDGPKAEPHWVREDPEFFDREGRHPHEPRHFRILNDWCGLKRSRTLFERIEAARDLEKKLKKSGNVWKKSPSRARSI